MARSGASQRADLWLRKPGGDTRGRSVGVIERKLPVSPCIFLLLLSPTVSGRRVVVRVMDEEYANPDQKQEPGSTVLGLPCCFRGMTDLGHVRALALRLSFRVSDAGTEA